MLQERTASAKGVQPGLVHPHHLPLQLNLHNMPVYASRYRILPPVRESWSTNCLLDNDIRSPDGGHVQGASVPVVSIKNAKHYVWGENCDGWHLVNSEALSVIQERVPTGNSETRHFHNKAEQFFYVLSGTATLEISGVVHTIKPNEGFHVPAGVAHTLGNTQEKDLVFLVISTPPSHGDRVNA